MTRARQSWMVAVLLATGCAKSAATGTMAPEAAADASVMPGDGAGDVDATLADLQAEFDALDADLSAAGIPPRDAEGESGADELASPPSVTRVKPEPDPAPQPATDDAGGDRCKRICALQTSICDLSERMCSLADEHGDEPEYADACSRATDRCEQASRACSSCEDAP